jgi:allantoinase
MLPERRAGMDHPHYAWSPICARDRLSWPGGARVAVAVIVNLEHLEWHPPKDSYQSPLLYTHLALQRQLPELWSLSHREYGHRVGVFRVLEALATSGLRPTVAMDAFTARHYPFLVRHCLSRQIEIIAHGVSLSRMVTSRMSEEEERAYIRESIEAIAAATGRVPAGWHGPEFGESERTPRLLAEEGLSYVCDWVNDEQPYRMTVPSGELFALPIMIELDDVFALRDCRFRIDEYAEHIAEAFETIYREAAETGKVFVLNLHPFLSGQPFRIGFLEKVFASIGRRQGVWAASGSEIIDWVRAHGN